MFRFLSHVKSNASNYLLGSVATGLIIPFTYTVYVYSKIYDRFETANPDMLIILNNKNSKNLYANIVNTLSGRNNVSCLLYKKALIESTLDDYLLLNKKPLIIEIENGNVVSEEQ